MRNLAIDCRAPKWHNQDPGLTVWLESTQPAVMPNDSSLA